MSTRVDTAPLRSSELYSVLGALVAVLVPHVERMPLWVSCAVGAILIWRGWLNWRAGAVPGKWLLIPLTVLGTAGIVLSYGPRLGRDAAVALLAIMLALKVLEVRALRDATVAVCLGFFLIITNFLYSQTIPTALYMVAVMAWLIAILVALQDRTRALIPAQTLRTALMLMLQAVPLTLALFLLFPRVQGPLFGFPQATSTGVSGLSDSMSPGSLSRLSLSDDVAFRVRFRSPAPPPQTLYWRGPVLWDFDGRTWTIGETGTTATGGVHHNATTAAIQYTVTLEPHYTHWLFAIDLPTTAPPNSVLTNDYQLLATRPIRNRLRYDVSSHLGYSYGLDEQPGLLRRALRVPRGYNPKSLELGRQLRQQSSTEVDIVRNALGIFRSQPFFYTLVPPELGNDPVDEFLFVTRRGFCEHYASSFVFLMRAAGVPARVVIGYQGGEMNPLGDYMIVRQSEAHAWAEVWLKGEGWVRVDPTAAVSPARIQSGIAAALPAGEPLPVSVRGRWELLNRIHFTWDAMANFWNQWVLGYTPDRQTKLFTDSGFGTPTWQTLTGLLMSVTGAVVMLLALLVLRQLLLVRPDPAVRLWGAFCRKLAKRGIAIRPGEGPRDFARRAAAELPPLESRIRAIADLYVGVRYAGEGSNGWAHRLRHLVSSF
jgi:protein-glutamine gamma-glutamyltransferase